ncbi:MAG: gamma-glutamylcyclotransferase family protein [Nanoarchaeota archaeon]
MADYLIGYGSFMNAKSRAEDGDTVGEALPAIIRGYRRVWNTPDGDQTAVGCIPYEGSIVTGAIALAASTEDFSGFDARETGYGRTRIPLVELVSYPRLALPKEGFGHIYVAQEDLAFPSEALPISQAYLDVVLNGCLSFGEEFGNKFGEEFAKEWVLTTYGWEYPWLNDRKKPRYSVEEVSKERADLIDAILLETIPEMFKKRVDE